MVEIESVKFMNLRWFLSRTVRHATAMRKHVYHLLCAQRDILSPQAVDGLNTSLDELAAAIRSDAGVDVLKKQMEKLEQAAHKWLLPHPAASLRENVEILLVTVAVAMAIRTFFIQPFKIPTGSMQPTLFGVTSTNLINQPDFKIPTGFGRFMDWVRGTSYVHVTAGHDGQLEAVRPPVKLLIFGLWQKLNIGGRSQTILFPPDYGSPPMGTLEYRADLLPGQSFHARHYNKGDDVIKLQVNAGDYLFVDRLTFNFRKPRRGEIVVFETRGMDENARLTYNVPGDQFYIKRLVGLGGETLSIGKDHHLTVDGKRLDASTPGFENVYGFDPAKGEQNAYWGHMADAPGSSYFVNGSAHTIATNHFMILGDNTRSSLDSRFLGDVQFSAIVGKAWFVYWPLSSRFGLGYN